ncbi:MAG: ATP-dependent zinc metalloprotease FtsH [Fusobacteriaceae bacterium]
MLQDEKNLYIENEPDKDPKENGEPPKNNFGNGGKKPNGGKGKFNIKGLIMLLFIITIVLGFQNFLGEKDKSEIKTISYSEFLDYLNNKTLVNIEEKEGYVFGYPFTQTNEKPKQSYKARMITDRLGQDVNLLSAVNNNKAKIKSIPDTQTPFFVSLLMSWFPMLLLIGIWVFMFSRMSKGGSGGGPQIFSIGKSRVKENGENVSHVTFADVAGIDEAKLELQEVVHFLKEPFKFKQIGAKIPRGVLLLGAPGTGKTLLAKAVAGEAGVPFLSMSGSEFVEMFVGVGASRVRDLFGKAKKVSPCIIFIDEIDAVGRKRGTGQGGGNDEREQTLNQLLVEMDGFGNDETIIVLAATNRPDVLDKALMRPGRFDRQVFVDSPDMKGREEILKVHIKGKKIDSDVDLSVLARKTIGFVGADLANLLNEAAILAARSGRESINMSDLEEASEKVLMGPEKKSKVIIEKEKLITAYHEVGHALVSVMLPHTIPVHKITMIPRGRAGGYTSFLPTEDRSYKTKKEFMSELRVLLGGRAAEQIVFDDISTGASNDIERATGIAHAMVTRFGMNDKFGPILLDSTNEGDMFAQRHYSESTGKDVDTEIRNLILDAYKDVIKMLTEKRYLLELITKSVLERETLSGDEFRILFEGKILPPFEKKPDTSLNSLEKKEPSREDLMTHDEIEAHKKAEELANKPKNSTEEGYPLETLDEKLDRDSVETMVEEELDEIRQELEKKK